MNFKQLRNYMCGCAVCNNILCIMYLCDDDNLKWYLDAKFKVKFSRILYINVCVCSARIR